MLADKELRMARNIIGEEKLELLTSVQEQIGTESPVELSITCGDEGWRPRGPLTNKESWNGSSNTLTKVSTISLSADP